MHKSKFPGDPLYQNNYNFKIVQKRGNTNYNRGVHTRDISIVQILVNAINALVDWAFTDLTEKQKKKKSDES